MLTNPLGERYSLDVHFDPLWFDGEIPKIFPCECFRSLLTDYKVATGIHPSRTQTIK